MNDKEYPKWIDHPTDYVAITKDNKPIPKRILVLNAKEEEIHYPKEVKKEEAKPNWNKKN